MDQPREVTVSSSKRGNKVGGETRNLDVSGAARAATDAALHLHVCKMTDNVCDVRTHSHTHTDTHIAVWGFFSFPWRDFSQEVAVGRRQPSGAGVVVGGGGSGSGGRTGIGRRGSMSDEGGRSLGHVRLAVVPGVAAVVLVAAVGGGRAVEAGHAAVEAPLLASSVDHGVAPGGGGAEGGEEI